MEPPGTYSRNLRREVGQYLQQHRRHTTHKLKKSLVCSKPRYSTTFGWLSSRRVALSLLIASTTAVCLVSARSESVLGSSTCLTAIISPLLTLSAR